MLSHNLRGELQGGNFKVLYMYMYLYPLSASLYFSPLPFFFSFSFFPSLPLSPSSRYRVIEEVGSNAGDLDEDTGGEGGGEGGEESGEGGGFGYQTSWGPVGYSRKDHCLQILVSEVLLLLIIFVVSS